MYRPPFFNFLLLDKILLLVCCITAGIILKKTPFFNDDSASVLNKLIIYFFIPLIAIYQVPKIEFQVSLIWLTLAPFILFGLSVIFFQIAGKIFSIETNTKAALILTSGISSTSFVGFPIFEILYGTEGLVYGVLMSLGGTVLVFNTIGISTLFYYTEGRPSIKLILKKVFTFVPFIAFLIGLGLNVSGLIIPEFIDKILAKLVAPFSVIALLSIGMQMNFKISKELVGSLMLGQFFKLILAPIILYFFIWHFLEIRDTVGKVIILGSAIGSMNAMSIFTAEKGLSPKLAILMPAIGIPLSIPLLFIINSFLK